MAKAYSTLTIVDLLDTATYIYYAVDDKGTNASKVPTAERKYIGIYSGPALSGGQPETPPKGTEWFKYLGDDGQAGAPAPEVKSQYAASESGPWEEVFNEKKHKYVRFSYNGGKTYGPAIKIVGDDAQVYTIETNQEEILKFGKKKAAADDPETYAEVINKEVSFAPEKLIFSFYKLEEEKPVKLLNADYKLLVIDEAGIAYTINYNLENLDGTITFDIVGYTKQQFDVENQKDDFYAQRAIVEGNVALKIALLEGDKEVAIKPLICRFGMSSDMAQLGVYANNITLAMQSTKVKFDSNGLHIENGGFDIKNLAQERVFYADTEGNLIMKGRVEANSGIFNGTINATDGSFSGTVNAKGGCFSQNIVVDGLLSIGQDGEKIIIDGQNNDKLGIYTENFFSDHTKGFYLDRTGKIIANDIVLGNKAVIEKSLQVGDNCFIYSPKATNSEGKFIVVKQDEKNIFSLDKEGTIHLGNNAGYIELNAKETYIQGNYQQGIRGWKISGDKAEFNNIVARGTFEGSVFAQGKVQTVGGILLVRPSTMIARAELQEEKYVIYPETRQAGFAVGDYCVIGQIEELFKVVEYNNEQEESGIEKIVIEQVNKKTKDTISNFSLEELRGKILINYGQKTVESYTDINGEKVTKDIWPVGISINSSDNSAGAPPHAITIFQSVFEEKSDEITLTKKPVLIMGEMNGEAEYGGLNGYGLYADNVYLKGALISSSKSEKGGYYSGINTSSRVIMPEFSDQNMTLFPGKKLGEILLWAGAEDNTAEKIRKAPFKVDTYGNLYAGSGFFNGTIISNAEITAAKIRTAVLEGWNLGTNATAALSIIDADVGINFKKAKSNGNKGYLLDEKGEKVYEDLMILDKNQLYLDIPLRVGKFVANPDGSIEFDNFFIKDINDNQTSLKVGQLEFLEYNDSNTLKTVIKADSKSSSPGLKFFVLNENRDEKESDCMIHISKDKTYVNTDLHCERDIYINNIIEYRQVMDKNSNVIGYDLYVKE